MELDNVLHSDVQYSPLVASMTNHYSNQFTNSTQKMNHQLDAKSNDQANISKNSNNSVMNIADDNSKEANLAVDIGKSFLSQV